MCLPPVYPPSLLFLPPPPPPPPLLPPPYFPPPPPPPLGVFSPTALVIKLASSVGLLTLTATLIECLALYILPNKQNYREQIIDVSTVEMGREAAERKKRIQDPKAS